MKTKSIVVDIDGTLSTLPDGDTDYSRADPIPSAIKKLKEYKRNGYTIILYTSRNMRTYQNNIGKILANTAPVLFDWLTRHEVPFDEIHFGKPWPGPVGFYVDDRAIRPSEFTSLSENEIYEMLLNEASNHNS